LFFAKSRTGGFSSDGGRGAGTVPDRSKIDALLLEAYNSASSPFVRDNVSKAHIEVGAYTAAEISKIEQWFQNLKECERPIYSMVLWRVAMKKNATKAFTNRATNYYWSSSEQDMHHSWYVDFRGALSNAYWKWRPFMVRPNVAYTFIL